MDQKGTFKKNWVDSTQMSPKKVRHVNSTPPKPRKNMFLTPKKHFLFFLVRP